MNEEIVQVNNVREDGIKHYQYLDALRGIAALLVLSVHMPMIINIFNGNGFGFGAFGVELFYILSAFTLFLSSEQRFPVERKPVLKFFIRRFFRIAPLFYIVSIVVFLFKKESIYNFFAHILFLFGFNQNWINTPIGGEWSVFCEVWFYLSLPLIFKYIKNKKQAIILLLISFASYFIFKGGIYFLNSNANLTLHEWSSMFIFSNYSYFALGILLYFIVKERKVYKKEFYYLGWLIFFIGIASIIYLNTPHFGALITSLFLALLIFLMKENLPVNIIFNNKLTRFIGKISYSMYLWHISLLLLFAKFVVNKNLYFFQSSFSIKILLILFIFSVITIVSYISYFFVEKTGINFGKKIISRIENSRVGSKN